MASGAQGDEIVLCVPTLLTPELIVVDLQIRYRSAALTSPAIALEHLQPEMLIGIAFQGNAPAFG